MYIINPKLAGKPMFLTIIIPVWNEVAKITDDVKAIIKFVKEVDYQIELIIVDDGSKDNTAQIAEKVSVPDSLTYRVFSYSPHRGKGYAVRKGISESSGEYVMFMDSGRNVPVKFIGSGLRLIEENDYDILNGSRYLPDSIITKRLIWYRQITSTLFRNFVKKYLKLPSFITDTQCGFKFFRGDVIRKLGKICKSDGFIFDLELILLALEKEYLICEFPIEWTCDRDSRLSLIRSLIPILSDLKKLKTRFNK